MHNSLDVRADQKNVRADHPNVRADHPNVRADHPNVRADFQQPLRMKFSNFSKVPIESKSKSPEFQRFLPL
ncbi:prolipoprotein [Bifidobacterium adolescentis ATCC 15703]|uniref:Prolipoprotein n=1 Tax=Bifidobacterium adolescentis (strain ATCC 15703 / DSM 20083 / NCTC 11814 / E194a) TaxID=367928 RepID=A1A349_BIFAA|nr:prolipoprotein [Bifidobacterium adolescentis ATCC 15703]